MMRPRLSFMALLAIATILAACARPTAPAPQRARPCWVRFVVDGIGMRLHYPHCPTAAALDSAFGAGRYTVDSLNAQRAPGGGHG